ncbi:MAG: hypothetical protein QNJ62_11460 [Methyloceanibacter sp.]|nr:hypothetical protein [Methyloceanibacter sp.]
MALASGVGCGVLFGADLPRYAWGAVQGAEIQKTTGGLPALQQCRQEPNSERRLRCYDEVAAKNAPPTYAGKLGYTTEPFTLDRPHLLRFRSQGVVFVLYVLDQHGQVVQNLHIGGGGEDTYLIDKPGTYSLQIDGSSRWQIWLDPV